MTTASLAWLASATTALAFPLTPPGARPGECYAHMIKPAVYATQTRQVIDRPAWTETRRAPARTETVVEQVLVSPETVERSWHEPVYRETVRWETIPGAVHRVQEPARYQEVRETVEVEPGHYEWQKTWDHGVEILCSVWVPGRQSVAVRQVMVSPGRAYEVQDAPVKRRIVERTLVSEGGWSERRVPAVYRSETRVRVLEPEHTVRIEHAAVYRTETSQVLVSPEGESWERVNCKPEGEAATMQTYVPPSPPPHRYTPPPKARPAPHHSSTDGERG